MKYPLVVTLIVTILLSGFDLDAEAKTVAAAQDSFQPPDERKAQDKLPQAKDALWATLAKTKIKVDETKGLYKADIPDEVKKLNGQTLTISGFMVPLESTEKFKHFLLSKRTPTCPYCQPGAPNEIVEVYTNKDTAYVESLSTFEGKFQLTNQEEAGIFFVLADAIKK